MRSSSGAYFIGLDHIRAVAALLVYVWHFNSVNDGHLSTSPVFPLSVFTEGHIGVALFMTLSGYIFAKLLDDKGIRYLQFLWNRALRLFPLLILSFVLTAIIQIIVPQHSLGPYLVLLLRGFVTPEWPNGGWSIAVELHFYILLPLLLLISAHKPRRLLAVIVVAMTGRALFWYFNGQVQTLSYWTIAGCIDLFVAGIFCFKVRSWFIGRHFLGAVTLFTLLCFVYYFDSLGGFFGNNGYPTPSPIWIYYPTITGACMGIFIAWYDGSFTFKDKSLSGLLAKTGACSYSIYLLHFFIVFELADFIHLNVADLSNVFVKLLAAAITFVAFVPFAYMSFKLIELPPMKFRRPYVTSKPGVVFQLN